MLIFEKLNIISICFNDFKVGMTMWVGPLSIDSFRTWSAKSGRVGPSHIKFAD